MTARPQATPGPWHVNAIAKGRIIGDETAQGAEKLYISSHNATVATVYRPRDARLIATAPALRDALEGLLAEALAMNAALRKIGKGRPEDGSHPDCAIEAARAALALATGQAVRS